jgi:hypothetical protein
MVSIIIGWLWRNIAAFVPETPQPWPKLEPKNFLTAKLKFGKFGAWHHFFLP